MAYHPLQLALRFMLELAVLFISGRYFFLQGNMAMAILVPILLMAVWSVFAVKGDKSRSGKTVVNTPGWLRLIIELSFFGFAFWCLWNRGEINMAWWFVAVVLLHYFSSYERIRWLMQQ